MAKNGLFSRANLLAPIDPRRGDLLLLTCCFVTGMLDCGVFNNYGVFVGMQTGNTIILCLSTASLPISQPLAWATTLVSLVSFATGSLFVFRLSTLLGPLRRYVLTLNFGLQATCIVLAAAVTSAHLIPLNNKGTAPDILDDPRIIGALPALAFQSGATIATSRMLGYGTEIPVNVLTSTYAALATDENLFRLDNAPRNRRVGACVCVLVGAFCAAWIQKRGPGLILVLWMCVGLKLGLAAAVLVLMPAKETEKKEVEMVKGG